MRTRNVGFLAAALLVMAGTMPATVKAAGDLPNEHRALARFERAVEHYADLHRRLAAGLPALTVTADAEQILAAVDRLAAALRTERAQARVGAILDPDIGILIRRRLHDALNRPGAAMLPALSDLRVPVTLGVNEPFPWDVPNAMWPWALDVLPRLPAELEYRFVGYDLVLVDVDANLIVDVLPAALPLFHAVS